MQQTMPCASCGAQIPVEARFCRNCGQPSARFNRESVTEGTTRLLDAPERPPQFAQESYERPGELAQATTRLPPQAAPTAHALDINRKPTNWVLIGAIVIAAIALIATGLFIGLRSRPAAANPPVVTPGAPPLQPPPLPGLPPLPPPPASGVTEGSVNPALVYPGAKTVMQITGAPEGSVVQLQTSDPFDKVVSWYKEKLKPSQTIETNEPNIELPGRSVILPSEEATVIITAQDGATNIMVTQGRR